MEHVYNLMTQAVEKGVFPGGVLLASTETRVIVFEAFGYVDMFSGIPVQKDTIFDLASFTKPLATTLSAMRLIQQKRLDLSSTLGTILPLFSKTAKSKITIAQLLVHNSGLPAHRPYYEKLNMVPNEKRRNALRKMLVDEPLISPIGEKVCYSDLGFMILSWVVEIVTGKRLDCFVAEEIYKPLGLDHLFFIDLYKPGAGLLSGCESFAATEFCPWRKMLLKGFVHDDNAYAVGGIEGHAGLFGTAGDVNRLLTELMGVYCGDLTNGIFDSDILRIFFKKQKGTGRALGFDMPSFPASSCGQYFSAQTVGHLGFTGVSFWMDLERRVVIVLLTNRVHPSRDNIGIRTFRPKIHDAVMKYIFSL